MSEELHVVLGQLGQPNNDKCWGFNGLNIEIYKHLNVTKALCRPVGCDVCRFDASGW